MKKGARSPQRKIMIKLHLRTPQLEFLNLLVADEMDRDPEYDTRGILSKSMRDIIARAIERDGAKVERPDIPSQKTCHCFFLERSHLEYIDGLAVKLGVQRSEIARRLIDRERTTHIQLTPVQRPMRRF